MLVVAPAALAQGPAGTTHPPGNNGTVKVDGIPFDDHPDNEPHVGCVFEVDFYGFDEGDLWASVRFDAQAPTGNALLLEDDPIFIGGDSNAGGGSEEGLDAHRSYDLSDELAAFDPHPQQGYHVKLTVHADGSQGADTKYKVFWIETCGETVSPTSTTEATTTTTEATTTTTEATTTTVASTSSTATTVAGVVNPSTSTSETVLGNVIERPRVAPAAGPRVAPLARTGAPVDRLVALGAALSAGGVALVAASRRRRLATR